MNYYHKTPFTKVFAFKTGILPTIYPIYGF